MLCLSSLQEGGGSFQVTSSGSSGASVNINASTAGVNRSIQALAHRYCVECKGTFDELSKIIQVL